VTSIRIDLDRTLGTVDRRIFGGFVEHLGRCVYGGVFEEGSPLSDANGFRRDVLEAAKGLRMPLLRWPGGNFVSGYHWTDGIGPRGARPRRPDLAWNTVEPNHFGTDEFMTYCRELGTDPYLCLNMGTGTLDEALAWVEYCNGTGDTYWADRRRQNGHEEPYAVRYWGLGNEMWGDWQIGSLSAEEYVAKAVRWAKALRRLDPDIVLVSCGQDGWSEWDRIVIDGLVKHVDFHSIHIYTGSDDYWTNVLEPHQVERALQTCQTMIDRARYLQKVDRPVHVAYDEWNVWFAGRANRDEHYSLADALAVATYLNAFVRQCRSVRIANLAQLVNVIAPIFTDKDGLFLQTIHHPLRLAAEHTQDVALDVRVDCDTVEYSDAPDAAHRVADLGPFPVLDVSATRDHDRSRVVVSVVNRSLDEPVKATLDIGDAGPTSRVVARTVTADDVDLRNSFDRPDAVTVIEHIGTATDLVEYEFPPHSHTQLDVAIEAG
jgi:alpha-N-arabinofuranosidase